MKIAIAGKGGSGKTTIAGTLARLFAQDNHPVLAIDGDSNPNLGITLGIPAEKINDVEALPGNLIEYEEDANGDRHPVLQHSIEDIADRYGTMASDDIQLLAMKKIDHAGAG